MRHLLLCFSLLLLLVNAALGQPNRHATEGLIPRELTGGLPVWAGTSFPPHPEQGWWYCHTERRGEVHLYWDGEWRPIEAKNAYCPELRHGLVWLGAQVYGTLLSLDGKELMSEVTYFTGKGNLVYGHCGIKAFVLTTRGDTLAYFSEGMGVPGFQTGLKLGPEGLSIPEYVRGIENVASYSRHDWGMVDTLGNWIIPPVYDIWFIFRDGVAEVGRYCKRFKIDRNGNRVD